MEIDEMIKDAMDQGSIENYRYFTMLKDRKLLFNSNCDSSITEKIGMALLELESDGDMNPVDLFINSEGGNVFDSLYICNIIDNYKKPLRIHILGYALSMGFLLAIAGKNNPNVTKDCYDFSIFMLHSGSLSLVGDAGKAKSFMHFNESLETKEKNYVLTHTTMDEETYDKFIDNDYWLTAEEALNFGIIDKIIGVNKDVQE